MLTTETSQFQLRKSSFDLTSLIESVAGILAGRASIKGLEIIAYADSMVPSYVQGCRSALQRILLSLGKNVIQYASGNEMIIHTELEISTNSSLSVRFTLSGIGADVLPKDCPVTFDGLVRAEKAVGVGRTSLSLSAARRLAEMMGSEIQLVAFPVGGSSFTFVVKLIEMPAPPVTRPVNELVKGSRVLIVDHSPASSQALTEMLELLGCRTRAISSSAEVVPALVRGLLSNTPFRLVLLDLRMPDISGEELLQLIRKDKLAKDTKVVLLAPFGKPEKLVKARSLYCSGVLTRPVRRLQLCKMVEFALCLQQVTPVARKSARQGQEVKSPNKQKLNILLAEDDVLSQQISAIVLGRIGLSADFVYNGAEALSAIKARDYDIVFMDMQMPVMNGLDATREIRKLEGDKKNVPIIAMTASDAADAEQRCLEAGMNDYITKPFDIKRLSQVISACMAGIYGKRPVSPIASKTGVDPIENFPFLDVPAVLPFFGDDLVRYREFLEDFLSGLPERLQSIEAAYRVGDWISLARGAHTLKGVSATLGAMKLSWLAARLDSQSRVQPTPSMAASIHDIHDMIGELMDKAMDMVPEENAEELLSKPRVLCVPI